MKSYSDHILDEIDKSSYAIDMNWFEMKFSSLDGLLLIPEANRAKELRERNQNLAENLSNFKGKLTNLENEHHHLTVWCNLLLIWIYLFYFVLFW